MAIEIYEDDDLTLVSDLPITGLEAGADSDTVTLHAWNDKGGAGATARSCRAALQVQDRTTPTLYLSAGWPPVDEQWGRIRVVGYDNTGDATWSAANTDWLPLGAYAVALLGDVPANCALYLELKMRPPSTASELDWTFGLGILADEYATPVPTGLTAVERGVVHGVGDPAWSGIVRGGAVTATGTPDDEVHVAAVLYGHRGKLLGKIASDHTLNQNDSAAAALAAGQSYYATLSLGASGVTVTKGTKGTSPTKPAVPAGELFLRWVQVLYQAGGTSVIQTSDITGTTLYDRYLCVAGSGLQVAVHPGRGLGGGTLRFAAHQQLVSVPASDTSYLWQLSTGLFDVEQDEIPPAATAEGPWATIVTDGSAVTAITDTRRYAGRTVVLTLAGALPGSPGLVADLRVEHEELWVEEVTMRVSDNGGGSSGETKGDLEVNGTSLYPGAATEDHRPVVAYNASTLFHRDGIPDGSRRLRRGDLLEFLTLAHPTGGTPARGELTLLCRCP